MSAALIAGNWKMNGTLASTRALLDALRDGAGDIDAELAVFPPAVYLAETAARLQASPIRWGAQTLSEHEPGAYTGELAALMLNDFGCHYALVGHSERRTLYGETDSAVVAKLRAAQRAGITPVLCVGETLQQRQDGATETVVGAQLDAVVDGAGHAALTRCIIAYEPVWAIGTGQTATPAQAQAVHAFIRSKIAENDATMAASLRILYGGSMKAANAAELLAQPDIDGGLIGGASLQAEEFLAIARAAR